jgi:hypothetical protein
MSPDVMVKGFRKCCMSMEWMALMIMCCGIAAKRRRMLGVSVKKMKALSVKVETVTLIG